MSSKRIILGTDVATFVLFHPDDLAHRADDPIAWYAYDFAWQRESQAGRLVAFGTGADGGYAIRLTTDGLSAAEAALACQSWSFPLMVRHGRILLDNTDALPGEERMTDPDDVPEQWFELDNGSYRVTVHALAWEEAPGAIGADGRVSPDAPPSYVVVFEPVADLSAIPAPASLPWLVPDRDAAVQLDSSMQIDALFTWPREVLEGPDFPALPVEPAAALVPGQELSLPVGEAVAEAAFPERDSGRERLEHFVVAPAFAPGGLACLAWANGLARLLDHGRGDAAFRARLPNASFELERLAALGSAEAVTGWALAHLDLSFAPRLNCYASPAAQRIVTLTRFLDGGGLPPEPAGPKPSLLGRLFGRRGSD